MLPPAAGNSWPAKLPISLFTLLPARWAEYARDVSGREKVQSPAGNRAYSAVKQHTSQCSGRYDGRLREFKADDDKKSYASDQRRRPVMDRTAAQNIHR